MNKIISFANIIAISGLFFTSSMYAQNTIPLGTMSGGNGIVFPEGKTRLVLRHMSMDKDKAYNGDEKVTDMKNRKMSVDVTKLLLRTGLGNGFDIRVILPYMKKEMSFNHPKTKKGFEYSSSGIGDVVAIGKYQLLNQKKGDFAFVSLGLGVKFPTGDTDKKYTTPKGQSIVPTVQNGSGSTDYIAEFGLTKFLPNSRIDSQVMYKMAREGDNNFEYGDKIKWNIGYSYALNKNFDLDLGINGDIMKKNKLKGKNVDSSGYSMIYVTPAIHYKVNKKFDISLAYSKVIDRDINYDSATKTAGLSEDNRVLLRVGYNF